MLNRWLWAVATLALRLVTPLLVHLFRLLPDRGTDEHQKPGTHGYRGRWFERLLTRFVPYRDIVKILDGHGEVLYLRRFFLTPRSWPVRLFLHHIVMSDVDRLPHDHPFRFTTAILKGAYVEDIDINPGWDDYRLALPGCVLENPAEHIHKVTVLEPVWTLVLTGRAEKQWGFYEDDGSFIPWRWFLWQEGDKWAAVAKTEPEDLVKQ